LGKPAHFRDALRIGGEGPEMATIPAGAFLMGSPPDEADRYADESPRHAVTIARPFALSRYAVSFDEYDRYARAVGAETPSDNGWGRGNRPVIHVS
jgi:formylglycine-generating enzyme required for sulfatase activity